MRKNIFLIKIIYVSIFQYFGHLMGRTDSWKDADAGKDWRREEKGTTQDEMVGWYHLLNGRVWVNSGSWWWTGRPGVLQFMGWQRVRHNWATELNWCFYTKPGAPYVLTGSLFTFSEWLLTAKVILKFYSNMSIVRLNIFAFSLKLDPTNRN